MKLVAAAGLAVVAVLVWLTLVRQGPERVATATIVGKGFLAGSIYVQQPVGTDHSVSMPVEIPMGESNVFELRVDGIAKPVRASFNTVKGRQYDVGHRVRVRVARRGFPPLWSRLVVVDMTPADSS